MKLKSFTFMFERKFPLSILVACFLSLFIVTNVSAGKIAFESTRDGNWEVYVMNADGTAQTNLSNNSAHDWDPAWSPYGSMIAFASFRDGNWEIYVMNADGTGQTNLSNNPGDDWDPAWSPDGSKITFTSNRNRNWEVYVMNTDGTGQTNLSNNPGDDWDPAWSPDGSMIAFASFRDGNHEIYIMNTDGTGQTNLTNNPGDDWDPAWSPDGSMIAFASNRNESWEVYVMNTDGTGQTNLSNNPGDDWDPAWSPDGSMIAFASFRDGNREVYVMNADGSDQTNLTNNPAMEEAPDWGPEGIVPVCGNGILESGEKCDDGNNVPGDGCTPTCQLEPDIVYTSSLAFGKVVAGFSSASKTVTVSNTGDGNLTIGTITIAGTNPDQFSIPVADDHCSGQTVAPSGSCTVDVKFSPTSMGQKPATLNIPSNDPDENPASVSLSGNGVKIKVTSPNGGETLESGKTWKIKWEASNTLCKAANAILKYTDNGGDNWKLITKRPCGPGGCYPEYPWVVPYVASEKTQCKVKVIYKDSSGATVCSDTSGHYFTIKPYEPEPSVEP